MPKVPPRARHAGGREGSPATTGARCDVPAAVGGVAVIIGAVGCRDATRRGHARTHAFGVFGGGDDLRIVGAAGETLDGCICLAARARHAMPEGPERCGGGLVGGGCRATCVRQTLWGVTSRGGRSTGLPLRTVRAGRRPWPGLVVAPCTHTSNRVPVCPRSARGRWFIGNNEQGDVPSYAWTSYCQKF